MSNNNNSGINSVLLDQTLFILENYVEIMIIANNTHTQITRQQQTMVRKMNVLITELRRQQTIGSTSETIRNVGGSSQETSNTNNTNTTTNNAGERSPRERVRSRFEHETINLTRELFQPSSRLHNATNTPVFRRPTRDRPPTPPPTPSYRNRSRNSNTSTRTGNGNGNGNGNGTTNTSTTNPSGILLNFGHGFPFGQGANLTAPTFQTSFGRDLFENVPVFPSPEQVETATSIMYFQDISNPMNTTCPITMETFSPEQIVVKINHCDHIFNPTHIHSWFRSNVRCPVCRYDIRDDEPGNSASTEENTNTNNFVSNSINIDPLSSINETRENEENVGRERAANPPPDTGSVDPTQQIDDDVSSIARVLIQALLTPQMTESNTQRSSSLQSSINANTHAQSMPVSWSHIIPSVPFSPLTFTQQTIFSPSTGSINNETSPSSDTQELNDEFTYSIVDTNTQEYIDDSADEGLSQD